MGKGKQIIFIYYHFLLFYGYNYFTLPLYIVFRRVGLIPENTEDMWHAYNIIAEGDFVTCSTFR